MKKFMYYLLLSPIVLTTISCAPKKEDPGIPVDVIVISGQSNAVGCSKSLCLYDSKGDDKYYEYRDGYESIKIAYDCWTKDWPASGVTFYEQNLSRDNDFVQVKLGQGNGNQTFGPEVGIAERMHEKYANKLFIIKFACGGSNLKDDWVSKKSKMYGPFIEYVKLQIKNLKNKGYEPTIKAFCWHQGEGDAWPNYHNYYLENLRTFVGNVRQELKSLSGNKDVPFIDAGISNASVNQYWAEVNAAKQAFAAESKNNIYIDTIAAGLHTNLEPTPDNPDLYHYDSDSEIELGHLFAEAFEPFLMPIEEE